MDRYLDDPEKRYAGIDAVPIWATYPNLGIDNRNQHDMIRSMPGGVAGVKQMIADFHPRGVRVLFPMTMWDQGTGDPGMPRPEAIAGLMAEIGADTAPGTDGRLYPWGNGWHDSAVLVPDKSRTLRGPDLVGGHPKGPLHGA